jgi:hypothetical protein
VQNPICLGGWPAHPGPASAASERASIEAMHAEIAVPGPAGAGAARAGPVRQAPSSSIPRGCSPAVPGSPASRQDMCHSRAGGPLGLGTCSYRGGCPACCRTSWQDWSMASGAAACANTPKNTRQRTPGNNTRGSHSTTYARGGSSTSAKARFQPFTASAGEDFARI